MWTKVASAPHTIWICWQHYSEHFGHYLASFSGFIQRSYGILLAELYDIYKGLLLDKYMGI
jgi:hypothetical protein